MTKKKTIPPALLSALAACFLILPSGAGAGEPLSDTFQGTWCYVSGYQEPEHIEEGNTSGGTIVSFVFRTFDDSLYENVSHFYWVDPIDDLYGHIIDFGQKDEDTLVNFVYYNPNTKGSWAKNLDFSGNDLSVTYANYWNPSVGEATFSRVSMEKTPCPAIPYVPETVCGDGEKEDGEQCDDGNVNNGDGCSSTCRQERRLDFSGWRDRNPFIHPEEPVTRRVRSVR